jgi:hypothetical protein
MIAQCNPEYSGTFTKRKQKSVIAEHRVPSAEHLVHLMMAS